MAIHSSVHNLYNLFTEKESLAKMILIILLFVFAPESVRCQYSFTINVQLIGNSGGNCENMLNASNSVIANHTQELATGFTTKSECEMVRAGIIETIRDIEGLYQGLHSHFGTESNLRCSIKVIASPCTSRSGIGAAGDVDIFASGQGGAMFFQNPAVEVSNWAKENERLMSIIGGITDAASFNPSITGDDDFDKTLVLNLDKPFVSTNMREGGFSTISSSDLSMRNKVFEAPDYSLEANMNNVRRYLSLSSDLAIRYIKNPNPDLLTAWFHDEFKRVSGFDVDAIMRKLPSERTDEEKQALIDYQMYRRGLADKMLEDLKPYIAKQEETRAYEMAVLSANSYGDLSPFYLETTNYIKIGADFFTDNSPMKGLFELISECNGTAETGFHAEMYFNEVTGEFTISFEGTNFSEMADLKTDAMIGLNMIPQQHNLAMRIADYINAMNLPEDVRINITGHSLGGSLASVVGLSTGLPTYTFNSAGVNNAMIEKYGLDVNNNNIKAYQANNDLLTSTQEGELKPFVVGTVIATVSTVNPAAGGALTAETIKGNTASPAVGDKTVVESGGWHKIEPMINYFDGARGHFTAWQNSIHNAGYGHEPQTQETIMIYTGE